MWWRAIGLLCSIPFGTLFGLFARWTRLGLWRRMPVPRPLADGGLRGPALVDLGYRIERLVKANQALGITVQAIARGPDGRFAPPAFAGWLSGPSPGSVSTGG